MGVIYFAIVAVFVILIEPKTRNSLNEIHSSAEFPATIKRYLPRIGLSHSVVPVPRGFPQYVAPVISG